MTKKISFLVLALFVIISPILSRADYDNSIAYLQGLTQNPWVTQALVAAGIDDPDISYIDTNSDDLMTAAKYILALSASGQTNSDVYSQLVNTVEGSFDGTQFGDATLLNDDFWALLALSSIGDDSYDNSIKSWLFSHQNSDGGWSWATSGSSDSNDTAAGIMALLDAGLDNSSTEIQNAFNFLQSTQNSDGGFGYDADSDSDGASTAWIIAALNKAGASISDWAVNDNDPAQFLQSLEQSDGSFLWMSSDAEGSVMVTTYALVALSGATYPVNYIEFSQDEPQLTGLSLRIEGPAETICQAQNLSASTVLELLAAGAEACNFEYTTVDSDYGLYVSAIDGIEAAGTEGWQYWVDWQSAMVAVADYQLKGTEEVLWAFGGFPTYPTKIETDNEHISGGDELVVTTSYYDGQGWQVWPQAFVYISGELYQTDVSGQLSLVIQNNGVYEIYAQRDNTYVRSNKIYARVGDGVSQSVDLSVNINAGGGDSGSGDAVSFSVSQSNINFGDLRTGQSAETMITLANTGNLSVYLEASVIGSDVFVGNTTLNQSSWDSFNLSLPVADSSAINVGLTIPADWAGAGSKTGQLIFWGAGQN